MPQLDPLNLNDFSQVSYTQRIRSVANIFLFQTTSQHNYNLAQQQAGPAQVGEWIELNTGYNPVARYGHTADLYEPTNKDTIQNFKDMLRPADLTKSETDKTEDSMFMVVFGGKNA